MHKAEHISAADGTQLYVQHWKPDTGDIKAVILLVHGIAEHLARYNHVAATLVENGYAVSGMDLRGHGKSDGQPRVYVDDFHVFVEDIELLRQQVVVMMPDFPVIVLGHSMGGLISVLYALKYQQYVAALVTSGAALALGDSIPKAAIMIGRMLSKILPKAPVEKLDVTYISRDKAIVEAYRADPLIYKGKVRARMGIGIIEGGKYALERVETLKLPLLIMHGTKDRTASPDSSRLFYEHAGSIDKTLKLYDGLYHEIFNEPEQDVVLADVVNWLDQHC
jgi:alpha-beta hydrolase superfamily lysophospholipase